MTDPHAARLLRAPPVLPALDIERTVAFSWRTREFAILDPDGNLITFHQPEAG
jgi:hypothetical protein